MFVDELDIHVQAGNGGEGCVAFTVEGDRNGTKKPSGGNGGKGGSVYMVGDKSKNNLWYLRKNPEGKRDEIKRNNLNLHYQFIAENGHRGSGSNKTGKSGKDLYIPIPLGTIVTLGDKKIEISEEKEYLILEGGKGGIGNGSLQGPVNRSPHNSIPAELGLEAKVHLQLKLIADLGIIGLPNVGKSSFLNLITRAHAGVGDYSFTTKSPNLGAFKNKIIVDLPGLIEGAHEGKGLGHLFLSHVEKCQLLLHVLDASSSDPLHDYRVIKGELDSYGINKKSILALNKIDLISEEELLSKIRELKKEGIEAYPISVINGKGINELLRVIEGLLTKEEIPVE